MTDSIFIAIISFLNTLVLLKIFQSLFLSKDIKDKINKRSSHKVIATRSGGVSIIISIFIISAVYYLFNSAIYDFSLLIPMLLLGLIGLYDDVYNLDFKLKFIFQIIAAKIIIDSGLIIDNFHGLFGIFEINRASAQILTIFIICSIINSINFIDGIDGLAASVVIFFISSFEFFSKFNAELSYLSIMIICSLIPFMFYNFRKNQKIFLGDSGSLFLGGLISIYVLKILSNDYIIKSEFDINKILFVISILSYPIIDFTRVILIRLKNGNSPFIADSNHIHHILLNKFKLHYKVLLVINLSMLFLLFIIQSIF
jgi:UDP-N-acetylmuramyl pentapeptide phosphotransferase/UDP-N-acetylglucosamine-1-phosphate transferase